MNNINIRASLVLLAYNHETFIREAVQSALRQEFDGLEIILSDDCSSDGTFEVMRELAESYRGPHVLRLNRNEENLGISAHYNKLFDMVSADIVHSFAGDDISLPHRVLRAYESMHRENALLVHADANTIDPEGNPVPSTYQNAAFFVTTDPVDVATSDALYLGATATFHKEIFRKYGPLPAKDVYEDLILGFRAALEARVTYVPEALVQYRSGVGISHERSRALTMRKKIEYRKKMHENICATLVQRKKDVKTSNHPQQHEIISKIDQALTMARARRDVYEKPLLQRLRSDLRRTLKVSMSELNYVAFKN